LSDADEITATKNKKKTS